MRIAASPDAPQNQQFGAVARAAGETANLPSGSFCLKRLVADAVFLERVSELNFPANRERNRDIAAKRELRAKRVR